MLILYLHARLESTCSNNPCETKFVKIFEILLWEIFAFFMLETILLGNALKVNPFDQPSVELIKIETNKILKKN